MGLIDKISGAKRSSVDLTAPETENGVQTPGAPDSLRLGSTVLSDSRFPKRSKSSDVAADSQVAPFGSAPGIRDMPIELLQEFATYLSPTEVLAWAKADPRGIYPAIKAEVHAAIVHTVSAVDVKSLSAFNEKLAAIRLLPEALQAKPLVALGARIAWLPPEERRAAINAFLDIAEGLHESRPASLNDIIHWMRRTPGERYNEFRQRIESAAFEAADKGENLPALFRRLGIDDARFRQTLEQRSAFGPARKAVKRGEGVQSVVQRLGISNTDYIETLNILAAHLESMKNTKP